MTLFMIGDISSVWISMVDFYVKIEVLFYNYNSRKFGPFILNFKDFECY